MTLQLAVRITGDASSLTQSALEATSAVKGVGAAATGASAQASAAAGGLDRVAQATTGITTAQREQAAAATGAAAAMDAVARATGAAGQAQASATAAALGQAAAIAKVNAEAAALGRTVQGSQRNVAEFMAAGIAPRAPLTPAGQPVAPAAPAPPRSPAPAPAPAPAAPSPAPANQNLRRDQWTNLAYQGNDIVTSLASGISPMQVLAQQGGQVVQVLGETPGGIAGGLKIVAGRAMEILTPVRLMAAGFLGAAAGVVYLGTTWAKTQAEIREGLAGIGTMSRATVGDIERIAETAAAGGRIGRSDARGVATAVAATGKVDVANVPDIVNLAPGYAKLFGKDLKEAGSDLARIFADPVKGAAELDARIGGLDAKTQVYIRTLVEQGNRQEAIRQIVRAFSPDLDAASEKTSRWAKAWGLVSSAAEAAGRFVARPFTDDPTKERLAKAQAELDSAEYAREEGTGGDMVPTITRLRKEIAELTGKAAEEAAAPGKKAAAELSRQADDAVRALQPEIDQLEKLNARILLLQKLQGDSQAQKGLSASAQQVQSALDLARGAVETFMSAQDKARASEALTIRSIEARTVAEKAAIAAERERLALVGQAVSEDDRRQRVEAAKQAVLAQSTRDSQDRLRGANDNAATAGLLPYQRQRAELEAKYRKIFLDDQGNLPAIANDQKAKAAEQQALDAEAVGGPLRDANRGLTEQVAALRLQQVAFGASTEAAARMAAAQQLINQYTAAGVPITADLKRGIDEYAAAAGKVAARQEDLYRRQRELVGGLDDMRSGTRSGVTGIFSDVSQGKNPLAGITSSISSMASRVFDRQVSTPLANGLFGQEGKAGGGMFGDALGGIFGKAQGLTTADISAGIVNLSGPVSGVGALAASAANSNVPSAASVAAGLTGKSGSDLERAAAAIRTIESGSPAGNYGALGPLTKSGDRAYGAYQVMGNNIPSWTKEALGKSLTKEEFLGDKGAQDAVFNSQFGKSLSKYGNSNDAASVWFSGKPLAQAAGLKDVLGTSGSSYVDKFNKALPGAPAAAPAATAAMPQLQNLDASLQSFNTSTTTATQGLSGLTSNLTALPAPLAQTSQGLTQVGSSLGSGGGGGILGAIASLFGGNGSAPATVAAAGGGHVTGPGTATSDSIAAWLSNGEFVVNAAATKRNLPLLHALNDNRMPAFAEGGLVGMAVPPTARQDASAGEDRAPARGAAGGGGMEFHLHDNAGVQVSQKQTTNERGQPRMDVTLDRMFADAVSRPGSRTGRALKGSWGIDRTLTRRG
ncbi:phage tail length tape measure family protein [Methylobacterium flocculans]|uniref:phage tail length tape measure family protein n=1 Tax=Methylobacterium flocculans TaxID=2984843 RepID=UPI0021F2B1B9|nr:phage tail length tape measure family protein [Methylobacterium sp. FF17]